MDILLEERDGGFYACISDDGVGFAVDELPADVPGHLGLVEIRERAEMAGGWCTVRSLPGSGTRVEAWIPTELPDPDRSRSPGAIRPAG